MADHFSEYPLKHFAGIASDCMNIPLPEQYAPSVSWVSRILKAKLSGTADRAVLYHADAVGAYMWQKYTDLFVPVYKHTSLALPFVSTVPSVTPVAHASMYTGLDPAGHGIQSYTRPQLACDTWFDVLIRAGLKPCILAMNDSTFLHIFTGREMDYFAAANAPEIRRKALELIGRDEYDVISIHTFEYDDAAHYYGPESKEALNALAAEAEIFGELAEAIEEKWAGRHRTLLPYSPDHGQHPLEGGKGAHGSEKPEDMNIVHFFGTKR